MKKNLFFFGMIVTMLLSGICALAQPTAFIDEPVYTFEPVIEGNRVSHTFTVKNTGDSTLAILEVLPP